MCYVICKKINRKCDILEKFAKIFTEIYAKVKCRENPHFVRTEELKEWL